MWEGILNILGSEVRKALLVSISVEKLASNRNGPTIYKLLADAVRKKNICIAHAIAQFLMDEPVPYIVAFYIAKKLELSVRMDKLLEEIQGLDLDLAEVELLKVAAQEEDDKVFLKHLKGFRNKVPIKYKFPSHILSNTLKRIFSLLEDKGFSKEEISAVDYSYATCASLGGAIRYPWVEDRDVDFEDILPVYANALAFMFLNEDLSRRMRKKALEHLTGEFPDRLIGFELLKDVIEMDGEFMDRWSWQSLRDVLSEEELTLIFITTKIQSYLNPIPITEFEDILRRIRDAVAPLICPSCKVGKTDTKLIYDLLGEIPSIDHLWGLGPYIAIFEDDDMLYRSFRKLSPNMKLNVIQGVLLSLYEEDKEIMRPILKKFLEFSNKRLREQLWEQVNML